jgi:hypothetical protein
MEISTEILSTIAPKEASTETVPTMVPKEDSIIIINRSNQNEQTITASEGKIKSKDHCCLKVFLLASL